MAAQNVYNEGQRDMCGGKAMANAIRKWVGKAIKGLASAQAFLLGGLVSLLETGILLAKSFIRGCALLVSMGGCLAVFLLVGPVGAWLFSHPAVLAALLVLLFFPILGAAFSSALSAYRAICTAYLLNLAAHLQSPDEHPYRSYNTFRQAHRQAEEDAARREQERREQQQRAWEERFRQWHQQGWQYQQAGPGPGTANPYTEFKTKFEKSCAILGVPTNADSNKSKLAYRRQAKRYHPDLNKDPQATRQFQEISDAYEILSDDNIRRYQHLPPA